MTYEEYKSHLKVCELLGKPPTGKYGELHSFLFDIWDGMEFTVLRGQHSVTLHKKGLWYMTVDLTTEMMWFSVRWQLIGDRTGTTPLCTLSIIKGVVEERLGVRMDTLMAGSGSLQPSIEEHLMCEVGIPPFQTKRHDT